MNCIYNAHFMASSGHFLLIHLSWGMFLTLHSSQWLLNNNTKMFFSSICGVYHNFFGLKQKSGNNQACSGDSLMSFCQREQGIIFVWGHGNFPVCYRNINSFYPCMFLRSGTVTKLCELVLNVIWTVKISLISSSQKFASYYWCQTCGNQQVPNCFLMLSM